MALTKAEASIDAAKLTKLLADATRGPWRIDSGIMGDSLYVTAYEREGFNHDGDGPICHVPTKKHHYDRDAGRLGRSESRSWETPINKARADANLIVAAINALPELLRRLKLDVDEIAWLIEWPADRHGPTRYYSPGEPPVISADDALRFARQADAAAVIRTEKLRGCAAAEHMWLEPKPDRDSGSRPSGLRRAAAQGEAPQSGDGETGASPTPLQDPHP